MNDLTWIEINKQAIEDNIATFRSLVNIQTKLIPVIKSNAYGHDINLMAKLLDQNKQVNYLAVVSGDEALQLRQNNIKKPIIVLSFYQLEQVEELINNNIEFVISNFEQLDNVVQLDKECNVHLKFDIGTHRLGFYLDAIGQITDKLRNSKIKIAGVFSHYADSENDDQSITDQQTGQFKQIINKLQEKHINALSHVACSASTMSDKSHHFDAIRFGIGLYGLMSSKHNIKLKPALSWYTKIINIHAVKAGDYIGYARGFKVESDMKVATLPVGYWDGYNRLLSNQGEVIIAGQKCNVVGKICMNLTMVDISNITEIRVGDQATLIGQDNDCIITVDELAKKCQTINYEFVTRINQNIKRILI
ncbi:MAG: alanine racemase [Candidatus Komeilibacteria bacterium]